jgi:hypothetical protein
MNTSLVAASTFDLLACSSSQASHATSPPPFLHEDFTAASRIVIPSLTSTLPIIATLVTYTSTTLVLTSLMTLEVEDTLSRTPDLRKGGLNSMAYKELVRPSVPRSALLDRRARLAQDEGNEEKAETRCRSVAAHQRDGTSKAPTAARRMTTNENWSSNSEVASGGRGWGWG